MADSITDRPKKSGHVYPEQVVATKDESDGQNGQNSKPIGVDQCKPPPGLQHSSTHLLIIHRAGSTKTPGVHLWRCLEIPVERFGLRTDFCCPSVVWKRRGVE